MRSILFTLRTFILTSLTLLYSLSSYAQPGDFDCQYGSHGFKHPEGKSQLNTAYIYTSGTYEGKMLMVGSTYEGSTAKFGICRVNNDGTLDTTFGTNGWTKADFFNYYQHPYGIAVNSENEIYIVGNAATPSPGKLHGVILKLTEHGLKDTSFSGDGMVSHLSSGSSHTYFNDVIIQSDGKIVVGGSSNENDDKILFMRFTTTGSIDTSFGSNGSLKVNVSQEGTFSEGLSNMCMASDGDILATGGANVIFGSSNQNEAFACRITSNGAIDTSFDGDGVKIIDLGSKYSAGKGIHEDSNGKIYIGGNSNNLHADGNVYRTMAAVRLNADGSYDTSFSDDGIDEIFVVDPDYGTYSVEVHGSTLQSDGKFLVTGGSYGTTIARWDTDGNLDTSFSDDGIVYQSGLNNDWGYEILEYGDRLYQFGWSDDPSTGETDRRFALFRLFKDDVDMMFDDISPNNPSAAVTKSGSTVSVLSVTPFVCGILNPLTINSMTFTTDGTTDVSDLNSASLYYSSSNSLDDAVLYGTPISNPNGEMVFTSDIALAKGDNSFWLVYTLNNSAPEGNILDASFTKFSLNSVEEIPSTTTTSGSITIQNFIFLETIGDGSCTIPTDWTTVDEDGDGHNWYVTDTKNDFPQGDVSLITPKSGCLIASDSYEEVNYGELGPKNWLISKQIDLTNFTDVDLSYWYASYDNDFAHEELSVLVSTTTNDISSFTAVVPAYTIQSHEWTEKVVDLSAYDGQSIYIAFKHEEGIDDGYGWGVALDDIKLNGTEQTPNTPPAVATNNTLTLNEGGDGTITPNYLSASDVEESGTDLTFTVTTSATNGQLYLEDNDGRKAAATSITQTDLNNNRVSYTHDGSNTTSDQVIFTLSDGKDEITNVTFNITITAIDDTTPTLSNNTGTSLAEGATANISSTQLLASDEDSEDTSIIFAISTLPTNGTLYKSGTPLTTQSTFTNTEIDQLSYIHNHSNTTSDQFSFTVSDGTNTSTIQNFSFTITPVDDTPPVVTNNGKTINEGTTHTFTVTEFTASDEDSDDATLVFTINSLPINGTLKLNGTPVTVAATFNSSNIENLTYEHSGDETTTDSFNFIVSDGTNTTSEQTFAWTITAVNDAPTVTVNTGKTLSHSATHTFTLSEINASDTDNDAVDLYLIIDDVLPTRGTLYLNDNALTTGSQVTLAEINNGAFTYSPSDPSATSDSFTFTISDGTDASSIAIFNYSITNQAPTVSINNNQTVLVNDTYIFTTLVLNVTDTDDTDSNLKIVIDDVLPQSGTLYLNTTPLTTGSEFSLQDLIDGNISYQNNGATATSDSFSFRVYDGINYSVITVFNFTITQNAPPLVTINTGKTTTEGSEFTIDNTLIFGSDADDADFVFMLATVPTNGTLYYQGTTVMEADNAFLQSSLINGDIKYVHNGSNTTSDSFNFVVTDLKAVSDIATFSIVITPVDDDTPILVNNTGNTIDEGGNYLFTSTMLSASDTDTDDTTLTYTLNSAPSQGTITVNGTAIGTNGTFTTADISNAMVRYTHNGSNSTADNFNFTVTDGTNTSVVKTFTTTITPVDDDVPYITLNTGNTIDEGGNYALSLAMLNALDNDTDASSLNFTLSSVPTQGTLALSGTPLTIGSTFNLSHLSDFIVVYTHNGSNSTADNFNFTVTDGTNTSTVKTFTTTINPIDDDLPYITVNTGKTIDEGGNFTFSSTLLDISDNDTDLSSLLYTLTTIPTNGNLTLSSTILSVGDTFTRADVANLMYQHDDSNTSSDQLAFTLTDGTNTTAEITFAISITLLDDDAPTMVVENTSLLLEGATLNFSSAEFDATDGEIDNAAIIVTITSLPVNGQLKNNGTVIALNETFLFGDIGNISYEHDDTNTTSDQFSFTLGDGINTTTVFTEQIIITAIDDDAPVLTTNTSLTLLEGDAANISNSNLVAEDTDSDNNGLTYTLLSNVTNGRLSIGRKTLSANSTFTQNQVDGSQIKYTHNGSNTVLDSIKIKITDGTQTSAIETFYFVISPIDDDAPIVSINTGATIDEGESINLSTSILAATDVDIDNNNLKFFIVDGVSNGKMSKGRKRYNSGSYFTLSDIASGSIKYTHDHSNTTEDHFTFYVSDGTLTSSTQSFIITLNAIDDDVPEMITMTDLFLHIDSTDVMITHDDLHFSDDLSSSEMINYQVIDAPEHGLLYNISLGSEVDYFSQDDIDNNIIQYQLTSEDISTDEFTIMVSDSVKNTSSMYTVIIDIMAEDDFTNIYAGTIKAPSNTSVPVSKQLYHSLYLDQIPMETNLRMLTSTIHGTISYGTEVFTDSTNFRIERILTDSIMYNAKEVDIVTYDSVLFIIEHALTDDKIYQINFKISPDASVTSLVSELKANIKTYPMPFDNTFTIESDLLFNRYRLLSNTGHLITQDAFDMVGRKNINIGTISSGVYLLELTTKEGIIHKKIVKK